MSWMKGFAIVTCLATPLSVVTATRALADPAPAASTGAAAAKPAMTADEKKAKAADCSRQADAKKLHGQARLKFRASCKKM